MSPAERLRLGVLCDGFVEVLVLLVRNILRVSAMSNAHCTVSGRAYRIQIGALSFTRVHFSSVTSSKSSSFGVCSSLSRSSLNGSSSPSASGETGAGIGSLFVLRSLM